MRTRRPSRIDAQSHFMGQGKKSVAVAPALVAHVAGELRDEAAVAKERRKAREEASLRDKKKPLALASGRAVLGPFVACTEFSVLWICPHPLAWSDSSGGARHWQSHFC